MTLLVVVDPRYALDVPFEKMRGALLEVVGLAL